MTLEELKIVITAETNKAKNEIKGLTNEAKKMQKTLNDNVNTGGLKQINEGAENATKTFKNDTKEIKREMSDLGGVISTKSNQISKALIELMPSSLTGSFKQIATKIIEVFGGINVGVKATATNVGVKLDNSFKTLNKEIGKTGEVSAASFGLATANVKQLETQLKQVKTRYNDIMEAQEEIFNDTKFAKSLGDADYDDLKKEAEDAAKAVADAQAKLDAALGKTAQAAGTATTATAANTTATAEAGTAAAGASGAFSGLAGVLGSLGPILLAVGAGLILIIGTFKILKKVISTATTITKTAAKVLGEMVIKTNVLVPLFSTFGNVIKKVGTKIKEAFVTGPINSFFADLKTNILNCIKTNTQLSNSIGSLKGAFLTAFTPIINVVVPIIITLINALTRLMSVIASITSMLFGSTMKASLSSAKAMNSQAKAIGGVGKAAKEATKSLMGFDEINQLSPNSEEDTGGGGGAADFGALNFDNVKAPEYGSIKEAFNDLLDFLLSKLPTFEGFMTKTALGINQFFGQLNEAFSDPAVIEKVKTLFTEIARILNDFILLIDFKQIGETIGNGLNLILYAINAFFDEFNFVQLGQQLAEGINGIFETVDFVALGKVLVQGFNAVVQTLLGAVRNINWEKVGTAIYETLNSAVKNIDFDSLASLINEGIEGLFTAIHTALEGFDVQEFTEKVKGLIEKIDWVKLGQDLTVLIGDLLKVVGPAIGEILPAVMEGINELIGGIDPVEVGKDIMKFLEDLNLGKIIGEALEALATIVGGFFGIIWGMLAELFTPLGDALTEADEWLTEARENFFKWIDDIKEKIVNFFKERLDAFSESWNELVEGVKKLGDKLKEKWEQIKTNTIDKVKGMVDTVIEKCKNLATNFIDKITSIKDKVKEIWEKIKTLLTETFGSAVDTVKDKAKELWQTVTDKIRSIKTTIEPIITTIKNLIEGIVGVANTVAETVGGVISGIWNKITGAEKGAEKAAKNSDITVTVNQPNRRYTGQQMASGGIVDTGELFIAREAGPELVGTIGNKSAVANNEQIIEGIKRGVMEAMMSSNSENKETNVNLYLDSQLVAKKVIKYHNDVVKQTGLSPLFV